MTRVCDVHAEKRAAARQRFGDTVRFSTLAADVMEDRAVDAVMVLSPDWLHAEHAIAAMERGKSVFLEKPMATTIEDCDRILAAARQHAGELYVGHNSGTWSSCWR